MVPSPVDASSQWQVWCGVYGCRNACSRKQAHDATMKETFAALDSDGDEHITIKEVGPLMIVLRPGERQFAYESARHFLDEVSQSQSRRNAMQCNAMQGR